MKIFRKVQKKFLARLILCLVLFSVFGRVPVSFVSEPLVAYANTTPSPDPNASVSNKAEDEESYNKQYDNARKQYEDKQISGIADQVQPESNFFTRLITTPVVGVLNAIMYIALTLINTYFFVQTCFDIAFLIAPAFRDMLSGNQDTEGAAGKAARFCNGLISEAALNSVGYNKSAGDKRHIECSEMAAEVDWKSWLIKRLVMFISIMAYLALLLMGLLDEFVSLFTTLAYAIVKAVMELFKPDDNKDTTITGMVNTINMMKIWFR